MASAQCHKPSEKTNQHQVQALTFHKKSEIHHDKNHSNTHDHSLTDKVKEMAHKMFNHHDHAQKPTGHGTATGHPQKPTGHGTAHYGEKKKVKTTDGHEKNCMPRMLDHVKGKKKKRGKSGKHSGSGSDSGSSSDSDNEMARKKD